MIVRPITPNERGLYDATVSHPMQSYAWGEFRQKTGQIIERVGIFEGEKLMNAFELTFHKLPHTSYYIGYFPKGPMPDETLLRALEQLGQRHHALFIKLEPNISAPVGTPSAFGSITEFLEKHGAVSGKPLFTKYTFVLPLDKSEDALLEQMRPKTRYNIKVAQKKGVTIVEDSTKEGLQDYFTVLKETTSRQGFYAHNEKYFTTMWETLAPTGMMKIFKAMYEGKALTVWIVFVFNKKLYYPYGASSRENRDVMANNLMMWEMIKYGKTQGCTHFDMWGSLGPDADPKDPFFGFHKFKEGYGGTLTQFLGTYDLVFHPSMYKLFRIAETWRWKILRLRATLHV